MATDIGSSLGQLTGGFNISQLWSILTYGLIILFVVGGTGIFLYFFLNKKRYTERVTFWERNSQTGKLVAEKTIKAMLIRLDTYGNLVFRLKKPYKTKNVINNLHYPAKPHNYYVEYTRDGKIIEFDGISDYDDERKLMNARFRDENTELGRSSMHTINKERYDKPSWIKEHASLLVNIGAIVVIMVFLFLIAGKLISLVNSISGVVKQMGEIQSAQSNILDALNNLLQNNNIVVG